MTEYRFNPPLWLGLALSLAAHAFVLVPLLLRMMTTSGEALALNATFNPEDIAPPTPMNEPEIQLGIDEGSPSTVTWLGYREYEEHRAPLSDVEQAQFTDDPSTPAPLTPPMPVLRPAEIADATDTTAIQPSPTEAQQQDADESPEPLQHTEQQSQGSLAGEQQADAAPILTDTDAPPQDIATSPRVSPTQAVFAFAEQFRRLMETAASAPNQDAATQGAPTKHTEDIEKSAATQQNASAAGASPPSAPAPERSDKDADPSSIIEFKLEDIKIGKPLAAQGLTLRPQKPSFTTLTLMTAAPFNPLAAIEFKRDGTVHNATIMESSKDKRVDRAIEASLFRWIAEGKQLESLTGEQTITVRIRIILNPRRKP